MTSFLVNAVVMTCSVSPLIGGKQPCVPRFSESAYGQFSGSSLAAPDAILWGVTWMDALRANHASAKCEPAFHNYPQIISAVKHVLSLNVSDLSRILGVSRPTVYAWADATAQIKPENQARLKALEKIAQAWSSMTNDKPFGHLLKAPVGPHEPSLFDLLSAPEWEDAKIQSALKKLSATARYLSSRKTPTLSEIHAKRGTSPKQLRDSEVDRFISLTAGVQIP